MPHDPRAADGPPERGLSPGVMIGRYMILEPIARGDPGTLYSAYDTQLGRKLALKFLHDEGAEEQSEEARTALLNEAQRMARVTHPNVVQIHDVDVDGERVFLAMEFVDGVSLLEWQSGDHGTGERLRVLTETARALTAVHAAGLVHGDVNRTNVLVEKNGRVVVTDFAVAGNAASDGHGEAAASDQFNFAVVARSVLYEGRPDARGVPEWIRPILARALLPAPADRFPTMAALLAALERDPFARWRTACWLFAVVTVVAVSAFAFLANAKRLELACRTDDAEQRAAWGESERQAMARSFAATGVLDAVEIAERAGRKLDEFVVHWGAAHSELCRSARIRKEITQDEYRLRSDCLEREKTEVRAVAKVLVSADAEVVKKAYDIAYGLPDVAWCSDVATLHASAGLPDDPAKRVKVIALREQLAELSALQAAGKLPNAVPLGERTIAEARTVNHAPTLAEALYLAADSRGNVNGYPEMVPLLSEATWLALSCRSDAIAVRAASKLAFVLGAKLRKPLESELWMGVAHAAFGRIGTGANDELALEVMRREAALASDADGHPEKALIRDRELLAAYERLLGVHPKTALALTDLGIDYELVGEFGLARPLLERGLEMNRELTGAMSFDTGHSEYVLADCVLVLGELDVAEGMLKHAADTLERHASPYWDALAVADLSYARMIRGDATGAAAYATRANALLEKADTPELLPYIGVPVATAFISVGRTREALALCERAIEEQEKGGDIASDKVYLNDALRCKAEALLSLGREREAVPLLERSLTMKRRMYPGDYARAEFALARALYKLERTNRRWRDLANAAHDEFAVHPHLAFELSRVAMLLAAR